MHALVIGGTGMLSNVSLWLANEGFKVSVIGRNPDRMKKLINTSEQQGHITPLLVDYKNEIELEEQLRIVIKENGSIDLVIAWIHSVGKNVLNVVSQELLIDNHTWRLFQVLGSSSNLKEIKIKANVADNCHYRQVQLGFITKNNHSRWLTHEEISNGVIEAISNDKLVNIVGTIEPWEKRPY
ncbi:short-chain dehydrogenase [Alkalihalobacillus pseudalcaliphilus]|uniref:short-chain dehydrogenase n=1 Tax=Alkalihalobacillus pseudalcaliphilus TaxID=79884 RepID=UPI00064D7F84|nr:short-chain dehydrogenase [Alkalihalobacillus pseudalcaliphilus]KMK75619.1 short-chain dehydrogenase [Alkalihalobacillus pseudalcaliphilus]